MVLFFVQGSILSSAFAISLLFLILPRLLSSTRDEPDASSARRGSYQSPLFMKVQAATGGDDDGTDEFDLPPPPPDLVRFFAIIIFFSLFFFVMLDLFLKYR